MYHGLLSGYWRRLKIRINYYFLRGLKKMTILVTGGAGYIGSHTVLTLLENHKDVLVIDNLSNGSLMALARIMKLTEKKMVFENGDISDLRFLKHIFDSYNIESVIHFAGLKSVSESNVYPLTYYDNNVAGSVNLFKCMREAGVKKLVFSSSATVYGLNAMSPCIETMPCGPAANAYGATKAMVERILEDLAGSDNDWEITALRYFNPIGAHCSGQIGEAPTGIPNNLMPHISHVALGKTEKLSVFGGDYNTPDGTCLRDYVHVMDLAEGHMSALNNLTRGFQAVNLGTGKAVSVLELIRSFESINNVSVPFDVVERRVGDLPEVWASVEKARENLGWSAKRGIDEMVSDAWLWQVTNPNGYVD